MRMHVKPVATKKLVWIRIVRRAVDYGLTVGAALLCGHWIVGARW